jgi:hypothetical protein
MCFFILIRVFFLVEYLTRPEYGIRKPRSRAFDAWSAMTADRPKKSKRKGVMGRKSGAGHAGKDAGMSERSTFRTSQSPGNRVTESHGSPQGGWPGCLREGNNLKTQEENQ